MNQYVYLILNLGSLSIPLLYSIFEKEFHFIQYFKIVLWSIVLVAIPFLIWDAIFTAHGIWGFNPDYHLAYKFWGMPVEEYLFFICIPYACLFTHEVLQFYCPKLRLSNSIIIGLGVVMVVGVGILLVMNWGKWYTTVNFIWFLILWLLTMKYSLEVLSKYIPSFLIILIPFFIVNGILTGSFIEAPVVWYNNAENMGIRLFTIPLEDVFYAFNLLFTIQLVFNYLKNKLKD